MVYLCNKYITMDDPVTALHPPYRVLQNRLIANANFFFVNDFGYGPLMTKFIFISLNLCQPPHFFTPKINPSFFEICLSRFPVQSKINPSVQIPCKKSLIVNANLFFVLDKAV